MKKERDAKTIEAEMRKEQESLRRAKDQIRTLNAELTVNRRSERVDSVPQKTDSFKRRIRNYDGNATRKCN